MDTEVQSDRTHRDVGSRSARQTKIQSDNKSIELRHFSVLVNVRLV